MRRFLWLSVSFAALFLLFTQACTSPDNNNNTDGGTVGECNNHNACWAKKCPQEANSTEYKECLAKYLNPPENASPTYATCQQNKCVEIKAAAMGGGRIEVTIPKGANGDLVKWVMVSAFPAVDLEGKAITCERLKAMGDLSDNTLGRYFPPRDWTSTRAFEVTQPGDAYPLPIDSAGRLTIPANTKVLFTARGYCKLKESDEVPSLKGQTKWKWQVCKDSLTVKAGSKNELTIELPVSPTDSCD